MQPNISIESIKILLRIIVLSAHKIRLKPHQVQETYFVRAAATARFAYNWALAEWIQQGLKAG